MIAYISLALSVVLIFLDQLFKNLIVHNLPKTESIPIIEGVINFTYVENTGAAFGIFQNQRWILVGITSIALISCIMLILTKRIKNNFLIVSLSLVIAGGIGNLIDRVNLKYVIDYIELKFFPGFAVFNFADCLVVIGAIMLAVYMFFFDGKSKKTEELPQQITFEETLKGENNG